MIDRLVAQPVKPPKGGSGGGGSTSYLLGRNLRSLPKEGLKTRVRRSENNVDSLPEGC
ncbi:12515_t:CDS:2 [Rhizophagus irregularis]|nr:12515_t:CDS:2 [Rhizophagus irregularis]